MDESNNIQLVARLKQGDQQVFSALHQETYDSLLRKAIAMVFDRQEAEDIVQDAYMKLWENKARLTNDTNIHAYLWTLTHNTALDKIKRRVTRQKHLLSQLGDTPATETPILPLEKKELSEKILHYIDMVASPKTRLVMREHYLNGKDYQTIAKENNQKVPSVRNRVWEGITDIKNKLLKK